MEQNKIRTYLLYAAGEIFLVMVGILLALQVNNWNEHRKAKTLETKILKELSSDMQDDIISLENDVGLNQGLKKSIEVLHQALNSDQPYHDSLGFHFARINFNTTFTMKASGYDNLKSIGFQIITEDRLRKAITDLYASEYPFLKEGEETAEQAIYGYFGPQYLPYFISIRSRPEKRASQKHYTPKDFEALKKDLHFSLLLDYNRSIKEENLYNLSATLSQLKNTKKMIDAYLNPVNGGMASGSPSPQQQRE